MADTIDISARARVVDQASGPLKAIGNSIKGVGETAKTAGSALARMATQGAFGGMAANVRNVSVAFGRVGSAARGLLVPLGKVAGLVGFAGVAGTIQTLKDYTAEVAQLGRVSRRTGASREMVQGLNLMTGSAETAENVLTMTTRGLAKLATAKKPDPRVVDVFNKMGISLKDVRSGAITTDEVLTRLATSWPKQTNVTSKNTIATILAGKSQKELQNILARGPEELQQWIAEAQKRNRIDDEAIQQAKQAADAQKLLNESIKGVRNSIAGALLPSITPLIQGLDQWIIKSRETWLSKENLRRIIDNVVGTIKGLWEGIKTTVDQLGGWKTVMIGLGAYMARDFIVSVGDLGIQIAKLGASAVSLNPLSVALAGIGGAAYLAYQNWDTIGPKFEQKFGQISAAAQQAWTGIKNWALQSWQEILRGFQTGGLWGAITAAGFAAARAIIQSWDSIVAWFETSFPETAAAVSATWETIKSTARSAWQAISSYALQTINDIVAGWRAGGLEGAATATWNAIKSAFTGVANWIGQQLQGINWEGIGSAAGAAFDAYWRAAIRFHTWLGERLREIDWAGIASAAGNLFAAAWRGTINFVEWLRTLDWGAAGEAVGTALGNAVVAAFTALVRLEQWASQVDWGAVSVEVIKGLGRIVDAAADIGLRFIEGLIRAMVNALLSATGLTQVTDAIAAGFRAQFPRIADFLLGKEGAAPAIAAAGAEVARALPQGAAAAALPPPLAPSIAPAVAQPSLVAQARETQVRIDGEISQRLKVDMSPDLRAMLVEQRAQIADLRTRQQVEIGQSMAPALGLA